MAVSRFMSCHWHLILRRVSDHYQIISDHFSSPTLEFASQIPDPGLSRRELAWGSRNQVGTQTHNHDHTEICIRASGYNDYIAYNIVQHNSRVGCIGPYCMIESSARPEC